MATPVLGPELGAGRGTEGVFTGGRNLADHKDVHMSLQHTVRNEAADYSTGVLQHHIDADLHASDTPQMLRCGVQHMYAAMQHNLQSVADHEGSLSLLVQGVCCLAAASHSTPVHCNRLGTIDPVTGQ